MLFWKIIEIRRLIKIWRILFLSYHSKLERSDVLKRKGVEKSLWLKIKVFHLRM
jgi:hypothetical protein